MHENPVTIFFIHLQTTQYWKTTFIRNKHPQSKSLLFSSCVIAIALQTRAQLQFWGHLWYSLVSMYPVQQINYRNTNEWNSLVKIWCQNAHSIILRKPDQWFALIVLSSTFVLVHNLDIRTLCSWQEYPSGWTYFPQNALVWQKLKWANINK